MAREMYLSSLTMPTCRTQVKPAPTSGVPSHISKHRHTHTRLLNSLLFSLSLFLSLSLSLSLSHSDSGILWVKTIQAGLIIKQRTMGELKSTWARPQPDILAPVFCKEERFSLPHKGQFYFSSVLKQP